MAVDAIENDQNEVTTEDLIRDFKKFEKASYEKYKHLFEQIKEDRKFIAGSQLDSIDNSLIGEDSPKCGMNITLNAVRTVVNTYIPNQFKWNYQSIKADIPLDTTELNKRSDDFLSDVDNSTAAIEALTNSVGTALGVLVFSSDYDVDGSVKPVLYSIADVTNVRLDPNATKLNFADASKAAIVELKSKEWLRRTYGDLPFLVNDNYGYDERPLIDISENYDRKNYIPLVTYFVKNDNFSGVT